MRTVARCSQRDFGALNQIASDARCSLSSASTGRRLKPTKSVELPPYYRLVEGCVNKRLKTVKHLKKNNQTSHLPTTFLRFLVLQKC